MEDMVERFMKRQAELESGGGALAHTHSQLVARSPWCVLLTRDAYAMLCAACVWFLLRSRVREDA
jgi:hypothetical protein